MLPGFKMLATAINGNKIILIWVDSDADGYTPAASLVNYLPNLLRIILFSSSTKEKSMVLSQTKFQIVLV